jgi:integrase
MPAMPRPAMPYLERVSSKGKLYYYVRKSREGERVAIRASYGTPEFMAAYQAAVYGLPAIAPEQERLTLGWVIAQFMRSPKWQELASETRKQFGYQYARMNAKVGDKPLAGFTRGTVEAGRAARAAKPSDANKFVASTRTLFDFAVSHHWMEDNPAKGIAKLPTSKTGEGFHTWTAEEHAAFEARWPVGSMERLAYEIFLDTGLRRGDVHKFGPQHIRAGKYTVRTSKTGKTVKDAITPRLARVIAATAHGELVFLLTTRGTPFKSKQSLGNWFGDACKAAGVKGSAHGIRKSLASESAELGATEAQLNAKFGWAPGSKESATYVRKADDEKLAAALSEKLRKGRGRR